MGKSLLTVALIVLITINGILAGIDDNEVQYDTMLHGVKVYRQDRECAMLGGLCVHRDDCLELSSKQGLCPSNRHHGVECCYEIPSRPAPCHQHLGECMDRCPKELTRPGTDCKHGKLCCVLI